MCFYMKKSFHDNDDSENFANSNVTKKIRTVKHKPVSYIVKKNLTYSHTHIIIDEPNIQFCK